MIVTRHIRLVEIKRQRVERDQEGRDEQEQKWNEEDHGREEVVRRNSEMGEEGAAEEVSRAAGIAGEEKIDN